MYIEFLQDYSGRETAMQEYKRGTKLHIPHAQAMDLIKMQIVKEIHEIKSKKSEQPVPVDGDANDENT